MAAATLAVVALLVVAVLVGRTDRSAVPSATPNATATSPSPTLTASPTAAQGRIVTLYLDDSDRVAAVVGGTTVVCDFHIRGTVFDYRAGNEYRMEPVAGVTGTVPHVGAQHSSNERGEWRSAVISIPEGEWRLVIAGTQFHPEQRRSVTVQCPTRRTPVPTPTPRVAAPTHQVATVTGAVQAFALGRLSGEIAWVIASDPQPGPSRTVYAVPLDGSPARRAVRYEAPPPQGTPDTNEIRRQLSPDGRRLVLSVSVGPAPGELDLVIVDLETGAVRPLTLTPDVSERFPAWSPDGSRIAFIRRLHDRVLSDLRVIDVDGKGERLIFTGAEGAFPRVWGWTTDSRSIAYDPLSFEDSVLEVRDLSSGDVWRAGRTFNGGDLRAARPQFVGAFYESPRTPRSSELRVGDPFGAPPAVLAQVDLDPQSGSGAAFARARWHPSRAVVLALRESTSPTISVVSLDGSAARTLGTGAPNLAEWSPDGERIVYVTPRPQGTGPSNLLVQRLDGTLEREPDNSRFSVGTRITDLAVRRY